MKIDVSDLDCDFLVGSGHKMFGPTGVGFLYARRTILQSMPPWQFGGEMISRVQLNGSSYRDPPNRFEAGTPAIAQAIGLGRAIQYLTQSIGLDMVSEQEARLTRHMMQLLSEKLPAVTIHGGTDPSKRCSLMALTHPHVNAQDMATFLDYEGIAVRAGHHCCEPLHTEILKVPSTLRVSMSFYNTHEEVERFVEALSNTIQMLLSIQSQQPRKTS
eukprot:GHVS01045502.1.p1 GENE.GHVS01045502.1~~GHVS01045502.1.p1  ORF type:complete len:216 (+),score=16.77 GHVS01045502.1:502-1149(+)